MIILQLFMITLISYSITYSASFGLKINNTPQKSKSIKKTEPKNGLSLFIETGDENIPPSLNKSNLHMQPQSESSPISFHKDSAAQGTARYEQANAFKNISSNLAESINQHAVVDLERKKSLRDLNALDFAHFLKELSLIEEREMENIEIEKIESPSHYAESTFKVFLTYHHYQSSATQEPDTNIQTQPIRRLIFIIKFHRPRVANKETLHSEIGVKLHNYLRQQNTLNYPELPRLSLTEMITRVQLTDGARYMSIIHAAHGIPLNAYIKQIKESHNDLKNLMIHLGRSLATFHTYHSLRANKEELYREIREQLHAPTTQILRFNTITHGDLHTDNIFIKNRSIHPPLFYFIDLESMFPSAIDPNENSNDTMKIIIAIELNIGTDLSHGLYDSFSNAYNNAVFETIQKYKKYKVRNHWKNLRKRSCSIDR
ncbi:MAG: hypothetical protein C0432_03055 [Candidatus Puniceispirillum sp.]|nr:hypothetical protein [Candidatus Pelagibacter sp.]MBA4283253.1 hypothetical protein [Candidatus Puniceispirillum sp.]